MADNSKINKEEIEELKSLIKLLEKEIDDIDFQNLIKSGGAAKELLKALRKEASDLTSDISGIVSTFQSIVSEIKRTNLGVNETTKSFRSLTSIAQKIQYHQSEISKLTAKDIKKYKEKIDQEKINLANADKLLKAEAQRIAQDKLASDRRIELNERERKVIEAREERLRRSGLRLSQTDKERLKELGREYGRLINQQTKINTQLQQNIDSQENIKGIINDQDGAYHILEATLAKINSQLKEQEELLGIGGAVIGSLDAALNKLGLGGLSKVLGISDAKEEMQSLSEKIIQDKEKQLKLEEDIAKGIDAQTGKPYDPEVLKAKQEELAALTQSNAQYAGMNGKIAVLKAGIKSMGQSLIANLKNPITIAVFLVEEFIDALKKADQQTGELAKSMNLTYEQASDLRQEFNQIANLSMDASITTKSLQESYIAMSRSLGVQVDMNKANLELMTELREKAGLTNDEYNSMARTAAASGEKVKDSIEGFLGGAKAISLQANKAIDVKKLMQDTSKISNAIKLSIKGGSDALGQAAAQAHLLGMNLEQADKIAGSLLNFEDSINAELEAELLTGKDLNLEAARLAAINGNMGELTKEISKNIGSSADFTNMNRLQQEALAKAVGMTRDELANTLVEQEAIQKLGRELSEEEKSAFEFAKEKYGAEKARKMLGQGQLEDMLKQQSIQERFNQTVDKLREIFVSIADPILQIVSPLADLVSTVLPAINVLLTPVFFIIRSIADAVQSFTSLINGDLKSGLDGFLQIAQSIAVLWGGILLATKLMGKETIKNISLQGILGGLLKKDFWSSVASAIAKAWGAIVGFLGPFGIPVAITAGAGLVSWASGFFDKAGDVASPASGKTRISTKEGGLFELSNNDDFAAAPGLLDNLNKPAEAYAIPSAPTSKSEGGMSNTEVIALMREFVDGQKSQIQATKELANQPVNVNMDGEKVGEKAIYGTNNKQNKISSQMQ
jgi:hypothetical protein